jgi:hypothetical protein
MMRLRIRPSADLCIAIGVVYGAASTQYPPAAITQYASCFRSVLLMVMIAERYLMEPVR